MHQKAIFHVNNAIKKLSIQIEQLKNEFSDLSKSQNVIPLEYLNDQYENKKRILLQARER